MQLQINHAGWKDGLPLFEVVRGTDMKRTEAVPLPSPAVFSVIDHPSKILLPELRWYLEDYLQVPCGAYREGAESVVKTVQAWGRTVFDALFIGRARDWYQDAKQKNFADFQLKITTDSPEIMSWPWEALCNEDDGYLALRCCMERQLCTIADPLPLPENLPQDAIHILYIIARPGGEQDVGYHALAGSLVDYSSNSNLPVIIDVLRPPTFDQLQKVLRDRPGYYHIVHFDGHGGYGAPSSTLSDECFSAPEGLLVFETDEGSPEPIETARLSQLLAEYNIPVMVMNACQTGMIDGQAQDPFASVAAGLLKAGIRSVVAMGYSLYVSGAKEFVPVFYERLFCDGKVSEAVRAGRIRMFRQPERTCVTGKERLDDWLVPVLYQNLPAGKDILPKIMPGQAAKRENCYLPKEALQIGDYGFIGRGSFILRLERTMRQRQTGILIHGQAGIGKTTLAKGFLQWLHNTGGLSAPVIWLDFQAIHSVEYVINTLISTLAKPNAIARPMEEKLNLLTNLMRENSCLVVWDNFDSASGIEGTEVSPQLPEEDRGILASLLQGLCGGKTKILITSRAKENWLPKQVCRRIQLEGLAGEELWEYCNAVVRDLGLKLDRNNETYREILEKLCGNPLAIRMILLRLDECGAEQLLQELKTSFEGVEGDEATKRLQAAYAVFSKSFLEGYLPVLQVTGLFEQYVDVGLAKITLSYSGISVGENVVVNCYRILENAGLCTPVGQNIFRLHPALRGYLQKQATVTEALQRGFVEVLSCLAKKLTGSPLHEVGLLYEIHLTNFYHTRKLAETLDMDICILIITQSLAYFAFNKRQFVEASSLYQALAIKAEACRDSEMMAAAYHQLGIIAQEQHDFSVANVWYQKALIIQQEYRDKRSVAATYHQLGTLAQKKRDFTAAEVWYQKALTIWKELEDENKASYTYHQLGRLSEEQYDFTMAENWYQKAIIINEKIDEYRSAGTCNQLGKLALTRHDFTSAEAWFQKARKILEEQGSQQEVAKIYHQLGMLAQEKHDFASAEDWYRKTLIIEENFNEEADAALTYHQLGTLAKEKRDFTAAETWYQKALEIKEKLDDSYAAASTYNQLGVIAGMQHNYVRATDFFLKAIKAFNSWNDLHNLHLSIGNYIKLLHRASASESQKIRDVWAAQMPEELTKILHQMEAELDDNGE